MSARAAVITPRLLTRQQAATYCGMSLPVFSARCPVASLSMGPDRRLERYDVQALDEWIDRMKADLPPPGQNWLDRL